MKLATVIATVAFFSIGPVGSVSAEPGVFASWAKLADGVYELAEPDGSVTRSSFGAEGARYERGLLTWKIRTLSDFVRSGSASVDDQEELASLETALAGIPVYASSTVVPYVSTSGEICAALNYAFDSHFAVGVGGGTPIARVKIDTNVFGPAPVVTAITQYARAEVVPSGEPAVTDIKSSSILALLPAASVDWKIVSIGDLTSSSCTASTYSYMTVTTDIGACGPKGAPGFVSQSKSYPSCVGSL